MSDRELLELAAKAAGIETYPGSPWHGYNKIEGFYRLCSDGSQTEWRWNPLTDDGDALRLRNAIGASVSNSVHAILVCRSGRNGPTVAVLEGYETSAQGRSIDAATRRAITRAAAEIGRAMP